jgi:hypothetical protein
MQRPVDISLADAINISIQANIGLQTVENAIHDREQPAYGSGAGYISISWNQSHDHGDK